jgi:hypothetical protein
MRPINCIQLLPGIRRAEWITLPAQDIKQRLHHWRKSVDSEWIDLFACWQQYTPDAFTYQELCAQSHTEEQRLAWGLELLLHGKELFRRRGTQWTPLSKDVIMANTGFAQHLHLLQAGAGTPVAVNDQHGILTGRSTWRHFEVR